MLGKLLSANSKLTYSFGSIHADTWMEEQSAVLVSPYLHTFVYKNKSIESKTNWPSPGRKSWSSDTGVFQFLVRFCLYKFSASCAEQMNITWLHSIFLGMLPHKLLVRIKGLHVCALLCISTSPKFLKWTDRLYMELRLSGVFSMLRKPLNYIWFIYAILQTRKNWDIK